MQGAGPMRRGSEDDFRLLRPESGARGNREGSGGLSLEQPWGGDPGRLEGQWIDRTGRVGASIASASGCGSRCQFAGERSFAGVSKIADGRICWEIRGRNWPGWDEGHEDPAQGHFKRGGGARTGKPGPNPLRRNAALPGALFHGRSGDRQPEFRGRGFYGLQRAFRDEARIWRTTTEGRCPPWRAGCRGA